MSTANIQKWMQKCEIDNAYENEYGCKFDKDLKVEKSKGNFREDLYHRLAVIEIKLPSLSERIDDIKELTAYFLDKIRLIDNF